jgi:hypothetical protein
MAKENIVFGIDIETGKAAQSFSGIKTELKALTKAIGEIDPNSNAFEVATKRAGQLRDQIRGVNDAIENADPEKKFAPFSRTVQGLAGGFAAAQGAMALFGGESEELEKTLVKVQGAMALSQGLNSLLAFKNDFKALGILIINQVVKAFTTLRGALIATGIGALVVTLGTLIANWKEFSKAIENAFPGFKVVTDFFKNLRQIGAGTLAGIVEGFKVLGEVVSLIFQRKFSEAIATAKEFGARVAKETNEAYDEEDRKIKIENGLKDRKFALDLEEAKGKDVRAKRIQLMKDELSILEKGSEEYNAKLIEIETLRTEIRKEALDKRLEAEKQHELDLAEWRKEADERKKKEDKKRDDEYLALQKKLQVDLPKQFSQEQINNIKYSKSVKQKLDEEETAAKIAQLQMISSALSGYAQLLGQQTAAGKALAVAQTSIDTYISASAAFKNVMQSPLSKFMPDGGLSLAIIAAGGAVAAGIANVRRIVSVQVPGGGGGGNTAPSAGGSQSVPQFNPAVAQQVQGGGDVQLGMKPQKVYVVESDIRGTMNKVDVIEANATIG